jgi:peptide/nickel transport system permease protein
MEATFGFNQPLHIQYLNYMQNVLTFDFGLSFYYRTSTSDIVFRRLGNTLFLTIPALILAYIVGIIGGVFIGWNRGKLKERFGLIAAILFRSTPRFWLGLLLLFVFSVQLELFPIAGILPTGTTFQHHWELLFMPEFYRHIFLPTLSLSVYMAGLPLLLMRSSIFDVMNDDFVDVIRAKGASERSVMYKHVARNALLPVTTAFGVAVGFSFGGAVLVEQVFSYPGVGRLMVQSVFNGDWPVAQFSFLIMAGAILIMNLVVDLVYGVLDPRVTYG